MPKKMHHYKIVLPEHLNDYGYLFGGNLLKWIDEIAYIRVSLDLPGRKFVTIGLDQVEFKHQIERGQILWFECEQIRTGTTSVSYHVNVTGERYSQGHETGTTLFETNITFVCLNADGEKSKIDS